MTTFILLGLAACTLCCTCLYLASPNQRLVRQPWPCNLALAAAAVLGVLSCLALLQSLQRLTAAFVLLTTAMLVLALLPHVGAWRVLRRAGANAMTDQP